MSHSVKIYHTCIGCTQCVRACPTRSDIRDVRIRLRSRSIRFYSQTEGPIILTITRFILVSEFNEAIGLI